MQNEITIWGIHGGRSGEAEMFFEQENLIALGWKQMGDLSNLKTREDFKSSYQKAYSDSKPGAIPVKAGILYRFVREAKINDFVIFPRKLVREIYIGQISSDYEYRENSDFPHTRKVRWIQKYPRTRFSQGALYEIGSAMTFFQVKNYADEFLAAMEGKELVDTVSEDVESVGLVADDIEQQSRDFILKQISQKLKGHGLAEFVGHILDLMGYKTKVSEPGSDRGIDIIAHKDDLGVEPPVVIVQVKSSDRESNEAEVSQLYGKVSDKDFGLFVSLSGFNKHAYDFAFERRNLKLINGDEFVDLIYKYYDQIDGKYKAIIPLKKVYIPESPSE